MATVVASAALLVVAWLLLQPVAAAWRRKALLRRPFPPAWAEILQRRVPLYRRLPPELRGRLEQRIVPFLAEKPFAGCAGFELDDEVRVTVAAQACLLVLNRPGLFANLREVLVYPGPFVVERLRAEPSGVLQESRDALSGESSTRGQVVLSWQDVVDGAAIEDDGRNVVIHEFAHQLDQEKGYANGAPLLASHASYQRWSQVFLAEFARLRNDVWAGVPTLLSAYGATDPAEFFAVASEVFFEQPARMEFEHPALYRELRQFYGVDPARW